MSPTERADSKAELVRTLREKYPSALSLIECEKIGHWCRWNLGHAEELAAELVQFKTDWHRQYTKRFVDLEDRVEELEAPR